jgi:hypothetical protein
LSNYFWKVFAMCHAHASAAGAFDADLGAVGALPAKLVSK